MMSDELIILSRRSVLNSLKLLKISDRSFSDRKNTGQSVAAIRHFDWSQC